MSPNVYISVIYTRLSFKNIKTFELRRLKFWVPKKPEKLIQGFSQVALIVVKKNQ